MKSTARIIIRTTMDRRTDGRTDRSAIVLTKSKLSIAFAFRRSYIPAYPDPLGTVMGSLSHSLPRSLFLLCEKCFGSSSERRYIRRFGELSAGRGGEVANCLQLGRIAAFSERVDLCSAIGAAWRAGWQPGQRLIICQGGVKIVNYPKREHSGQCGWWGHTTSSYTH